MKTRFLCATSLLIGMATLTHQGTAQSANMGTMVRPIAALDSPWMEELTVLEVRDAIAGGKTTALVLTGGVESNGPYLPTGKHNFMLRANGEAVARRLGNALIAPIVTIEPGNPETARSPGGIRFSAQTYLAVLRDYATSLKAQGFINIVFMGDSGGNQGPMRTVAQELNTAWGGQGARVHFITEYYTQDQYSCNFIKEALGIVQLPDECEATRDLYHDDYHHTAIISTTDPERIRAYQRLQAGLFSINSVDLTPLSKTIANGRRLVEYRTEITVRAIQAAIGNGG